MFNRPMASSTGFTSWSIRQASARAAGIAGVASAAVSFGWIPAAPTAQADIFDDIFLPSSENKNTL